MLHNRDKFPPYAKLFIMTSIGYDIMLSDIYTPHGKRSYRISTYLAVLYIRILLYGSVHRHECFSTCPLQIQGHIQDFYPIELPMQKKGRMQKNKLCNLP